MKTNGIGQVKKTPATSQGYITMGQAAKFCDYSPAALDKDAKQKKLRTVKKGSNLLTTREWLDEYQKQSKKMDDLTSIPKNNNSDELIDEITKELI